MSRQIIMYLGILDACMLLEKVMRMRLKEFCLEPLALPPFYSSIPSTIWEIVDIILSQWAGSKRDEIDVY